MPQPAATPADPLRRVERLAKVLDEAVRIPGTQIKLGLDAVIGLIPVVGDAAGLMLGSWLIYEAHRLGTPAKLKWQMARNVAVDAVAGLVPVLGDLVDLAYRSNRRNVRLLRKHFTPLEPPPARPAGLILLRLAMIASVGLAVWWLWGR